MYQIEIKELNGKKTFAFHGAINSTNSEEVSGIIFANLTDHDNVVIDFEDVDFISSAGLRVILKAGKMAQQFEIVNVIPEVYEVFDMTGFTQILKISKALRMLSLDGKEIIGEGYMGRVYRFDPETIVKVYYRNSSIDDIKREIALAKTAFVLGLPTAIPFDLVKTTDGMYGSVFELLTSSCFNKYFIEHPENTDKYIDMYINLLKEIMSIDVKNRKGLPRKLDDAWIWFNSLKEAQAFTPEQFDKIEKLIKTIPDSNHIIHGDYHIKNIMMQGDEPLLIDMDTLGVGHEIFEFTAFFLTYIGYPATAPGNAEKFLGISQEVCNRLFRRTIDEIYVDKSVEERDAIVDKLAFLGYFWLMYKTLKFEPENKIRYEHAKQQVLDRLEKLQTLDF